jgi:hypothetical protein
MKKNQYGFSAVEASLILVIVGIIGGTGWYVWHSQSNAGKVYSSVSDYSAKLSQKKASSSSSSQVATAKPVDETKGWTLVAPKNTDNTFTVKVPSSLLPNGSCKTKEVLLAITYNSNTHDFDCSGTKDALGYASVVFGVSANSVVSTLGNSTSSSKVTLADGKATATKSIITSQAKGEGGSYTVRYELFEAKSTNTGYNYYAIYSTGVGFNDENHFLNDFEAAVTKGWTLP